MARIILDSGAVIALAADNPRMRQFVERAIRQRTTVVIPAVVVTETTRGGPRDTRVNRVIKNVGHVTPVTEEIAREAGRLLGSPGAPTATVDALVVAEAGRGDAAVIVTGDVQDITALAAGYAHVRIYGV